MKYIDSSCYYSNSFSLLDNSSLPDKNYFDTLANELLIKIFKNVIQTSKDITRLSLVNRRFHTMAYDQYCLKYINQNKDNLNKLLLAASFSGNLEKVKYLIVNGANIYAKDNFGKTPLLLAFEYDHLNIVQYLIEKETNINAECDYSIIYLLIRPEFNHLKNIVKYIIEKKLIEKKINIDANANGYTILLFASAFGYLDVVQYLIEKGADIEAKNPLGRTALLFSIEMLSAEYCFKTVQYLIEKGADIETKDNDGTTALILAAEKGYLNTVQYLIEKGADIEAKAKYGKTALMAATIKGHFEIVKYLVEKGADFKVKSSNDIFGNTALDLAEYYKHSNIVNYLRYKYLNTCILI